MLERLECEVLQKLLYINTLTFTFYLYHLRLAAIRHRSVSVSRHVPVPCENGLVETKLLDKEWR